MSDPQQPNDRPMPPADVPAPVPAAPVAPQPAAAQPGAAQHDDTMAAIGAVSLRLLAGVVPRRTLDGLKRTVLSNPSEYPWQAVNRVVLAEAVEPQALAEKALKAQRDWILRGGRENPGKPLSVHAKTFVAKLLTQAIFLSVYSLVVLVLLLAIKHRWPEIDVYRVLTWLYGLFPSLVPK